MASIQLYDYQYNAVKRMHNGCILCGGVGTGKSRTALAYYYILCGGEVNTDRYVPMTKPMDLCIITTARKRDTLEWENELLVYGLSSVDPSISQCKVSVIVESWNNISKIEKWLSQKSCKGVTNGRETFFIFDEQRVVGRGAWAKSFLKLTRNHPWILLSATPGDSWSDYVTVFIANGYFKSRSDFNDQCCVFVPGLTFPKIDHYVNIPMLNRMRDDILVTMDPSETYRHTTRHVETIPVDYDTRLYRELGRYRWDIFNNEPIENAAKMCYLWRRVVNEDTSRQAAVLEILEKHPRAIIFYNYDYELEILLNLHYSDGTVIGQWNGHKHEPLPASDKWVYIVQYTAGSEGWNCTKTDTIIFFSQSYSYKVTEQSMGRIDRVNTPYDDLYYYILKSKSPIDLAIAHALSMKKDFNESAFVKWK